MILLISQTHEGTTDHLIDWIDYLGGYFVRINGVDFYRGVEVKISNSEFSIELNQIDWEKISVVWYRRWVGYENRHAFLIRQVLEKLDPLKYQFNIFIREELKTLVEFFFHTLPEEKLFERTKLREINKLIVLKKAREFGITIPDTYILTKKRSLDKIWNEDGLITKAIANGPSIEHSGESYVGYTSLVDEFSRQLTPQFSPSLFQSVIPKKFEIRSFLLCGKLYSMAIFSQSDKQTSVDFRMYNYKHPNRTVPYKLPPSLEEKLVALAHSMDLKTGSFDIIKTQDNEYVFLEINPGGQFGMVSSPCNYQLEKKLACELLNFDKQ